METVGPPPVDDDLHLLHEWGDPATRRRSETAGVMSVLVHGALIVLLLTLPSGFLSSPPEPPPPERKVVVTPLVEPLTEFTQKEPPKGKINREIDIASLQPRASVHSPAPSLPRRAALPPTPPPAAKATPAPALPEPPKVEAAVHDAPRIELPPSNSTVPPPQIATVEKPKMVLENVGGTPPPGPPPQTHVQIPGGSITDAIRQNSRGGVQGGGVVVGDPGAGPGSIGEGISQSPAPGVPGTALQLKSDAMGVDFKPYLAQILVSIKRNWLAVYPESARLGRRGKVVLAFIISKGGRVDKVTMPQQSGTEALDRAAIAAVSASNPFPPLPPDFKGERIVLEVNFVYNMLK